MSIHTTDILSTAPFWQQLRTSSLVLGSTTHVSVLAGGTCFLTGILSAMSPTFSRTGPVGLLLRCKVVAREAGTVLYEQAAYVPVYCFRLLFGVFGGRGVAWRGVYFEW